MFTPTEPSPADPPPAPASSIRVRGLKKRFGARWALRWIDLDVARGETVALVGPNGAGKTTLLRILATLLGPSAGDVEVLGRPLPAAADEIRRRAGFLTSAGFLYDDLTGAENLRFAVLMAGSRPDLGRIASALDRAGLTEAADVRVRAYSTGMRRRLELARLLLRPVDLLLLDEPYASLDSEGIALVDEVLGEFRREGGTALLASHQRGEAVRRADRVVVLRDGRVAGVERSAPAATPASVDERPDGPSFGEPD